MIKFKAEENDDQYGSVLPAFKEPQWFTETYQCTESSFFSDNIGGHECTYVFTHTHTELFVQH